MIRIDAPRERCSFSICTCLCLLQCTRQNAYRVLRTGDDQSTCIFLHVRLVFSLMYGGYQMTHHQVRLSALDREHYLVKMAASTLDVLVIGGGITGAGIALDAAARGLSVGLIDKQDFAEGTSSRSTKLIHGGLRYLKQGEVGLVREVGRERAILHRNAPHLVKAEKMLLPIVVRGTYGKLTTSVGLWIYDRLARVRSNERRVMLSKAETLETEPLLNQDRLLGGGLYYEYRTDDARLTVEVIKTATQYGALCVNYVGAEKFLYIEGKVVGIQALDEKSGTAWVIKARKVVNATGPWVDELRGKDNSLSGKRLHLTKGVHIVVARERLPIQHSVYFDAPDGRMVFAVRRDNVNYIGTTDTDYHHALESPIPTSEDISYLIASANQMFPSSRLTKSDVRSAWAGVRPLIHQDGKSPSELSRKDEIFVSQSGLISIAGGKLTGYRKMAQRVVDLVARELAAEDGRPYTACFTDRIRLSGGSDVDIQQTREWTFQLHEKGFEKSNAEQLIRELINRHGSNTGDIVEAIRTAVVFGFAPEIAGALGEFAYTVHNEMVLDPIDFLIRRTGKLLFEPNIISPLLPSLWEEARRIFDWDHQHDEAAWKKWETEYRIATSFNFEESVVEQPEPETYTKV